MTDRTKQLEQLTAYLDGELSAAERVAVERWLEKDAAARALLAELRQTVQLVGSSPRDAAPVHMADTVLARMEREALLADETAPTTVMRERSPQLRFFALAASLLIAATAGWLGWTHYQPMHSAEKAREPRENQLVPLGEQANPQQQNALRDMARRGKGGHSDSSAQTPRIQTVNQSAAESQLQETLASPADLKKTIVILQAPSPRPNAEIRKQGSDDNKAALNQAVRDISLSSSIAAKDVSTTTRPLPTHEPTTATEPKQVSPTEYAASTQPSNWAKYWREGVLSNNELRQISAKDFPRQISLESDPAQQPAILAYISSYMSERGIPNVRERDLPEPIDAKQLFYLVCPPTRTPASSPASSLTGPPCGATSTEIIVNLPRAQADQFIKELTATIAPTPGLERSGKGYEAGLSPTIGIQEAKPSSTAEEIIALAIVIRSDTQQASAAQTIGLPAPTSKPTTTSPTESSPSPTTQRANP